MGGPQGQKHIWDAQITNFKAELQDLMDRTIIVLVTPETLDIASQFGEAAGEQVETTRIIRTVIEYAGRLNEQEISELQRRLNERINALREEKNPDAVLGVRAAQAARLAARAAQVAMAVPAPDTGY